MSLKKHYKLYKAGKQWCTAAIATVAIIAGLTTMETTVHADKTAATDPLTTQTQPTTQQDTNQGANVKNDSNVTDTKASDQNTQATDKSSVTTTSKSDNDLQDTLKSNETVKTPAQLPTGRPGWSQQNGSWYYFNNRGIASTGWQMLGDWYYFDPTDGQMQ